MKITGIVGNNKVKVKPTLYSLEIKLLKFENDLLNVGLQCEYVLKPLLILVKCLKMHRIIQFFLTGESNVYMFRNERVFEFFKVIR